MTSEPSVEGESQNVSGDAVQSGFQPEIDIPLITIAFFIVTVNSYLTVLISRRRDLRTPSNIILASLTVSDGLTGLVSVPLVLSCMSIRTNGLCITSALFIRFISILSAIHILLLTVDRYIFIVYPHKYYDVIRKTRTVLVLVIVWLVGLLVTLVRLDWAITNDVFSEVNAKDFERKERIYNWFCLSSFFIIPLVITIVLDAQLLYVLKLQVRKILQNNLIHSHQEQSMRTKKRERRAVLVYVVVVVTFILCWLPYFVYDLWQQWGVLPAEVEYLIMFIRIATSLGNPIMYTMSHRTLRRAVIVSLKKTFGMKKYDRPRAMSYQSGQSGGLTAQFTKTDTTQM